MTKRSLLVFAVIVGGCNSTSTSKVSPGFDAARASGGSAGQGSGGATSSGGTSGLGGTSSAGGAAGSGGTLSGGGGGAGSGGFSGAGGLTGSGGSTGGAKGDAAADARSDLAIATGGGLGTGGTAGGSGGAGSGGISGTGGTLADAGRDSVGDARPMVQPDASTDGYTKPVAVPDGGTCPYTGHLSYALTKSASPTADEQAAYDKITAAMDQAVAYYNCYTNITKAEVVEYDGSVKTADGNSNGTIRFGSDTTYMVLPTAMHEISHTVGVGTASKWRSFVAIPDGGSSGPWTGANGIAQRTALLPDAWTQYSTPQADTQHFWPYGLNYASEYKTEADLLGHCAMVMALRKDMGM